MSGLAELGRALDEAEAQLAAACRRAGVEPRRCRRMLEHLQDAGFSLSESHGILVTELSGWTKS